MVSDISFSVKPGEIVALIGASGAGKSLVAHALLGLLPPHAILSGTFIFKGEQLSTHRIGELRGREIALIPQSITFLNPLTRVGKQVYRAARLSGRCHDTARHCCDSTFSRYHLAAQVKSMFPFQVSGGMARRVLTATATAGQPDLIIADEPTNGLDPEATEQSLLHLKELASHDKAVVLITHDLENALRIADTLVVLHDGMTVEITPVSALVRNESIMHPYTRSLWQALPRNGFISLPLPSTGTAATKNGCAFADRCPQVRSICRTAQPPLEKINQKLVRCHHAAG